MGIEQMYQAPEENGDEIARRLALEAAQKEGFADRDEKDLILIGQYILARNNGGGGLKEYTETLNLEERSIISKSFPGELEN